MLRAEATLIATSGIVAGTVVAIIGLVPLAIATAGSPLPSGPPTMFVAIVAMAVLLVLAPTIAGTRIVLRRRPATEVERA
jgi:putative ABC transport system permease protein